MIPRIHIDYQAKPRSRWPGWALLGVVGVLAVDLALTRMELEDQLATWQVRAVETSRRAASSVANNAAADPISPIETQIEEAGGVIVRLNTPWSALFGAIEEAHGEEIALLSLQPDSTRRTLSIVGEARGYGDVLAYVGRLRSAGRLANAYLVGNEMKEDDPQRPMIFTVSANWKAAP